MKIKFKSAETSKKFFNTHTAIGINKIFNDLFYIAYIIHIIHKSMSKWKHDLSMYNSIFYFYLT
jgi:hypothetical protein